MSEHAPDGPDQSTPAAGPRYTPLPKIAERLGIAITKVHQMVRERALLAVRHDGILSIPAEFVDPETESGVVKGLTATITLLTDGGYSDDEIVRWLFTADESLPGTPIQALQENRGREVKRRAQTAGY